VTTRRSFCVGLASTALLGGCSSARPSPIRILDTHTHFYDPTRPGGVKWPPASEPRLYRPVLPPEFQRIAEPLGIAGTVVVEASPDEADNAWVLGLMPQHPFLRGLVGHLKPGTPDFAQNLRRDASNPAFCGFRTGGWDGPLDTAKPGFLEDCRDVMGVGGLIEVLVGPDRLDQVDILAAQKNYPAIAAEGVHTQIVIDHCANLPIDGKAPPKAWLDGMDRCARHAHVHCKFSGLVEGTGRKDGTAPDDPAFYAPVFNALWDRFGPERLIFGSNWPVSALFAPLDRVVRIARSLVESRGASVAHRCLRTNGERVYGVSVAP
jgi:predicted TIM-barrel fold metal-dependent hydrolase